VALRRLAPDGRIEYGLRLAVRAMSATTRKTYLDLVANITDEIYLSDLTTSELVNLAALLVPPHVRVLAERGPIDEAPGPRNGLRLVQDTASATNGVQTT
jgi:hypothetical protein